MGRIPGYLKMRRCTRATNPSIGEIEPFTVAVQAHFGTAPIDIADRDDNRFRTFLDSDARSN
jgi:hypothetical protein